MTTKRRYGLTAIALLPLCVAAPVIAAPEPLVVSQLPDPDPSYVPPPPERTTAPKSRSNSEDHPTLDGAFENLGRITGQLAKMGQQYRRSSPMMQQAGTEHSQAVADICKSLDNARSRGVDVSAWDKDCPR